MPVLSDNPKNRLTYGEYRQRLLEKFKKNPDDPDPEVQKLKKELEEFNERYAPSQEELARFGKTVSEAINTLQPAVKQILLAQETLQPTIKNILLAQQALMPSVKQMQQMIKFAQPTLKMLQVFQPPTYLFEVMNSVAKDFQRLSLPMKVIGEIFAIYEAPLAYYKLSELHVDFVSLPIDKPVEARIEPTESIEEQLRNQVASLSREVERLEKEQRVIQDRKIHYDYLRATFVAWQISPIVLNFNSEGDVLRILFEVLYECMLVKSNIENGVMKVFVSMGEIVNRAIKKGRKDANNRWVSFNIGNLNKKFKTQKAQDVLFISDFDRELGGYWFSIDTNNLIPLSRLLVFN